MRQRTQHPDQSSSPHTSIITRPAFTAVGQPHTNCAVVFYQDLRYRCFVVDLAFQGKVALLERAGRAANSRTAERTAGTLQLMNAVTQDLVAFGITRHTEPGHGLFLDGLQLFGQLRHERRGQALQFRRHDFIRR